MMIMLSSGTDFWRGSQFLREGEEAALNEHDAQQAGRIVSTFAETVDECSESSHVPASIGEALREKFQKVGKIPMLLAFRTELCCHALKFLQARVKIACEWSC